MSPNRREFFKRAAASAAALSLPIALPSRVFGANDEITVGVVGLGIRGWGCHVPRMEGQKGVRVVALAESDKRLLGSRAEEFEKKYGRKVETHVNMRDLFQRKDLVAVANATQNYWHGLSTIWACQAGKHVYCEKPLSHYIWEGRQMVKAARKYDRIVQTGTQARSTQGIREAIAWLQAGNLGKIQHVTGFANKPRWPIGKLDKPLEIPDYVNYDLWLGPARDLPVYRPNLQYDCSFDWNTGDGESCNQGVHEIDIARWLLGETTLPRRAMSVGGRFNAPDAANVPNTQIAYYDFPTAPVLYEVHNLPVAKQWMTDPETMSQHMPRFRGVATGVCAEYEGGYAMLSNYTGTSGTIFDKDGKEIRQFTGPERHFENFIEAVRAGDRSLLNADVLEGHLSTAVTHAGNISYRVGKPADQNEIRRQVEDIPPLAAMYDRLREHLRAQEIDLEAKTVTLGPWLELDRPHECFKDHAEANQIVRGFYREPYAVPEIE